MFVPQTKRERLLFEALRAATTGPRGHGSPLNYSVWRDGHYEAASGLSRDEAIGFYRGMEWSDPTIVLSVRCGDVVVWPEERWGEEVEPC